MTIQRLSETNLQTFGTDIKIYEDSSDPQVNGNSTLLISTDQNRHGGISYGREISAATSPRWYWGMMNDGDIDEFGGATFVLGAFDNGGNFNNVPIRIQRSTSANFNEYNPHMTIRSALTIQTANLNNTPHINISAGGLAGGAELRLSRPQGQRWKVEMDDLAENGNDTGTNFAITRHDDAGVETGTPITVTRDHGNVVMNDLFTVPVRTEASVPAAALVDGMVILDPSSATGQMRYYFNGQWHNV